MRPYVLLDVPCLESRKVWPFCDILAVIGVGGLGLTYCLTTCRGYPINFTHAFVLGVSLPLSSNSILESGDEEYLASDGVFIIRGEYPLGNFGYL